MISMGLVDSQPTLSLTTGRNMADVSVEFHALESELFSFLDEIVKEFGLFALAIRYPPFEIAPVKTDFLRDIVFDVTVRELALTLSFPSLPPNNSHRPLQIVFLESNPDALALHLGRLTDHGLRESWLSARTSDPVSLNTWRQVARRLRLRTKAGAVAINPKTGASSRLRAHRFTEGAMRLQEQGVVMLPLAGSSVVRLGG